MIITWGKEDAARLERMERAQRDLSHVLQENRLLRAENQRLHDLVRAHRIPNTTAPGSPPGRIAPADYGVTSREALARMDQASRVIRAAGIEAPKTRRTLVHTATGPRLADVPVDDEGPGISDNLAAHLDLGEG